MSGLDRRSSPRGAQSPEVSIRSLGILVERGGDRRPEEGSQGQQKQTLAISSANHEPGPTKPSQKAAPPVRKRRTLAHTFVDPFRY